MSKITVTQQPAPVSLPGAGKLTFFAQTDKHPYVIDDAGLVTDLFAGGGAGATGSLVTLQTDTTVVAGTPMFAKINSRFDPGQASGLPEAKIIGLAVEDKAVGNAITVQLQDALTLTTGQWDAVAGTSGGLVPGSTYWLRGDAPGEITATPPVLGTSAFNTRVGVAITTTILDLKIRSPIKL